MAGAPAVACSTIMIVSVQNQRQNFIHVSLMHFATNFCSYYLKHSHYKRLDSLKWLEHLFSPQSNTTPDNQQLKWKFFCSLLPSSLPSLYLRRWVWFYSAGATQANLTPESVPPRTTAILSIIPCPLTQTRVSIRTIVKLYSDFWSSPSSCRCSAIRVLCRPKKMFGQSIPNSFPRRCLTWWTMWEIIGLLHSK